ADFTRLVKEIDKDAFISVSSVMSVYGRGFDRIKSGKIKLGGKSDI
ncbi:MAG: DUF2179 domain-containing protein, partial [Bacteroidales bacterium]|nr:DUF2179 domain-containing protein [Bacteroidales bacterium]